MKTTIKLLRLVRQQKHAKQHFFGVVSFYYFSMFETLLKFVKNGFLRELKNSRLVASWFLMKRYNFRVFLNLN